jgi:hypothetical protein
VGSEMCIRDSYKLEPLINNNSLEPLINNNSLEPLTNINNESSSFETLTNIDNEETDDSLSTYSTDDNEIITYEDYLKNSNITKIIITNKELLTGYIRLNDKYHPWHHIKTNDEDLLGWLTYNIKYGNNCNYNKIINDICIKCYNTDITEYQFKYNEYLLAFHNKYTICDTKKLEIKYYDYDNEIDNNIIVYPDRGCIWSLTFNNFNNINIQIVDNILNSLINNKNILLLYKKLCYNIIVEQKEDTIFYDYNTTNYRFLSVYLKDLLTHIGIKHHNFNDDDIKNYIKIIKQNKPRVVFFQTELNNNQINKIINKINNIGIQNIFIIKQDKNNNIYNYDSYINYISNNNNEISNYAYNKHYCQEYINKSENRKYKYDYIFYKQDLLLNNYFKWCCVL